MQLIEVWRVWSRRGIASRLAPWLASLLCACGGGGVTSDTAPEAAAVVVDGPMQAARGARLEWTVHMPSQPADDPPTGYAITLPEGPSRIDIATETCAAAATTGCQRWTLSIGRDALPGRHQFLLRPIGLRAKVVRDVFIELTVLAPAGPYGRAEHVGTDGDTVIVATRTAGFGQRLYGQGRNHRGQLASGYPMPGVIDGSSMVVGPAVTDAFTALGHAPAVANLNQIVLAGGSVLARADGNVWGWGANSGGRLGFASDAAGGENQISPMPVVDLAGAATLAEGGVRAAVMRGDGSVAVRLTNDIASDLRHRIERVPGALIDRSYLPITGIQQAVDTGTGALATAGHLLLRDDAGRVLRWEVPRIGGPMPLATPVAGLPPVRTLAAHGERVIARDELDRLWWWLERGAASTVPALITGLDSVSSLSVGRDHGYAVRHDGTVWSFGYTSTEPGRAVVGVPGRVGALSHARSVSGDGWVITAHCSEGDGGLWKIDPPATPPAQRQPGFGDDCDTAPTPPALRLSVIGAGSVTSDPAGMSCSGGAGCTARFPAGSTVVLTAFGVEGRPVLAWGGDCAALPDGRRAQVTMPAAGTRDASCSVTFADTPPPRLRVTVSGPGSVRLETPAATTLCSLAAADPTGADCGRGTSPVTLTALPATGARFTGWFGACSGTSPTLVQAVTGEQTCTATFAEDPRLTLSVGVEGAGSVTSVPVGIACGSACSLDVPPATTVTLTAVPAAGQRFAGWGGDCTGTDATTSVRMSAARRCVARFEVDAPPPPPPPPGLPPGNLVLNPGFEAIVAAGGLPVSAGAWIGDATLTVAAEGGIAPRGGTRMLKFVATGPTASATLVSSQLWQVVDLSAWSAEIARGDVQADASAWFHRVLGGAGTDRRFDLRVLAFDGPLSEVPTRYAANAALAVQAAVVDTTGAAWQQAALTLRLPPGTRHVLVEIYAFEDVRNDAVLPEFDGHYADDVALVLRRP